MKKLLTLSLFTLTLLGASSIDSFSLNEKKSLLKELNSSFSSLYNSKTYQLKKGWNALSTPISGVDVKKTFDVSTIELVVVYDSKSKSLATYPSLSLEREKEILFLKYLEPHVTFFVLAKSDTTVEIISTNINEFCKKIIDNSAYKHIISTITDKEASISEDKSISIKTRYLTHNELGIYDDTRVMLIYPKIETKTKAIYKYGPASPRIQIKYAKEYEEKNFFIYDYKKQTCNKGIFPSARIPPYPVLKEIK